MTITLGNGSTVELADWIDDKVYSTVTINGSSAHHRPLPQFGEFPGDRGQDRYRWPDILHWYGNRPNDPARRHEIIDELRCGSRYMTRMLAQTIVLGLAVPPGDRAALVDILMATNFGDADSEWALANLIDAAVELAADENERLARAWADAARERRWSVAAGPPL